MNAHSPTQMKEWLSAAEIAEAGLPDIPTVRNSVSSLASRLGWNAHPILCRKREGLGGGYEYHIDILPPAARMAYVSRFVQAVEVPEVLQRQAASEPFADELSGRATEARDARLALLGVVDRFVASAKVSLRHADQHFCDLYNAGQIEAADWILAEVKSITPRTLFRWRQARKEGRVSQLGVDRGEARRGKGVLDIANDGAVKRYILGLLVKQPHLSAYHIRAIVQSEFGTLTVSSEFKGTFKTVETPPIRTFQRTIGMWKSQYKVELTQLTNPDAFKSKYRVTGRNSYRHITRPGQLWMIDASPADVMLVEGRHTIYVAIDVATRQLQIYVSKTPRAAAVGLLLRRSIMAWGVPQTVKTDNGSDFVAKASQRLFAALGIEALTSAPFTPEEKAFVERAIGTVQRDLMTLIDGFIGHSVADRKRIEERKAFSARLGEDPRETFNATTTAAEFQKICDVWAKDRYAQRPHAGLKGKTPFEVASSFREPLRMVSERALDLLLAPIAGGNGTRVVTKSGLRIDGNHYLCPHIMPETQVLVRMDPVDLGRVLLFTPVGDTYLGEAICPALSGIDPAEAVRAAKAEQARIITERMAGAKAEFKRISKGPALADLVLRQSARDAGKLVEFPKTRVIHETPEISAALDAQGLIERPATPMRDDDAAIHARLVAEFEATASLTKTEEPSASVLTFPEQEKVRFRRAMAIEKDLAAGLPVDPADALWLGGYQKSSEYSSNHDMLRHFGESYFASV